MKKAALTFGLFSLVMVATSFATPEKTTRSIAGNIEINIGTDGNGGQKTTGNGKKTDDYKSDQLNSAGNQLNSFGSESQSTRSTIKLD